MLHLSVVEMIERLRNLEFLGAVTIHKIGDKDPDDEVTKPAYVPQPSTPGAPKKCVPVAAFDPVTGELVKQYPSMYAAAKEGYRADKISRCLSGHAEKHGGYNWKVVSK